MSALTTSLIIVGSAWTAVSYVLVGIANAYLQETLEEISLYSLWKNYKFEWKESYSYTLPLAAIPATTLSSLIIIVPKAILGTKTAFKRGKLCGRNGNKNPGFELNGKPEFKPLRDGITHFKQESCSTRVANILCYPAYALGNGFGRLKKWTMMRNAERMI